ncbi:MULTISPECIES: 3,4-dihydroxy-2-butanone-4-phosphate synthase [unclassified Paenibacillus]|uniref:3,4-dihydroxy-2-butanone-4-phosphate synthase n=1 Tax=unclassified Paenibacillus TaxID=185978 RepID=UPI001AEA17FD|nr:MULTISPECIES: 3,4-dihydroxy-2-butanone-4-phosphate synthase [unclassified Paenibacillus]MBP1155361.1 3,4-dihydroxy-2-butanone 4-phosphate synthase [Paenibacillus sp. PvP091]MBP1169255.1 3,4-dihydroxy-2-butanone 4-phosphate synthase [Paenibacillus sp. PvR098]MBP2440282.1 3,4-dihydroxy-2-butanone 4-phosphate synthase [Paenibacillus sp. PvP052]
MSTLSNGAICSKLTKGELVIVYDDIATKVGSLVGIADLVSPQAVNLMTKIGKGLIYVCISEEKAKQLQLPLMVCENRDHSSKPLTVSVDHITTTTGISAFERSDTIRAFTSEYVQPDDFRRPGHVFPLLSKDKGLLQRIGIAEAAVDLAKMVSAVPMAYMCEILNHSGEIANQKEMNQLAEAHDLCVIHLSEIIELTRNDILASFTGLVIQGREVGRKIGFPTANMYIDAEVPLEHGVYGVTVSYHDVKYVGVMNVGVRPTFNHDQNEVHHEIHLLHFNNMIYGKVLQVDVNFFVRNEISFSTVDQLINQIKKDIEVVEHRYGLVNNNNKNKVG